MSSDHLLLDALNHRVAAYEKLHQLQPALRDAKRMIELKPCLSKVSCCTFRQVHVAKQNQGLSPMWKSLAAQGRK
jgi:hypothetical protein